MPHQFGRYELRRLLGRGGMGSVYLAHDRQLDRDVALKMPRPLGDDPGLWRERFMTEARAAATLSHPNICPVHDVGEHDGQPYLTMAFIDGETLAASLRTGGPMPVARAVQVVVTVARAMAEAHARGIVHRDLKPGNILLDRRGQPVVTDFGLALRVSAADDLRMTLTGVALGTPAYMPPEQAGGDVEAIGPPADVYALGVILFELVTGHRPFLGRTFGQLLAQIERDPPPLPSGLVPGLPPALDAVILTALAKDPADRFASAAEFADALEQFQAGRFDALSSRYGTAVTRAEAGQASRRPSPTPARPRPNPGLLLVAAVGLVGLAGALYVGTDYGKLTVEFLDPDTGGPIPTPGDLDVKVNGRRVVLDPDGSPTTIPAGDDQTLVVTGGDYLTESRTFSLGRWKDATIQVPLTPKRRLARGAAPGAAGLPAPPTAAPPPETTPKPPPRAVEFPAEKSLIELPGWQILADATKDDAAAWLADRKKAGHSVTWLDTYPVAGQPVYSAVAALDDRLPGWEVTPEVTVTNLQRGVLGKPINFNAVYPRSMSGFNRDEVLCGAVLWHPVVKGWNYMILPDQQLDTQTKDAARSDVAVVVLRPFPNANGVPRWAFVADRELPGGSKAYLRIAPGDLALTFEAIRKEERLPLCLAAMAANDGLTFTLTAGKNADRRDWLAEVDLPAARLAETAKERAAAGYRPECVTAYAWDAAVRYCVVWVKDPPEKPGPER